MNRRARLAVTLLVATFGAVFATLALARFRTFHNETFDLAFYARLSWGIVRGDLWDPIVGGHLLGLHLAPVLALTGALGAMTGALVPSMLVLQSLAVALTAIPLARFGARRLGPWGAVAGAFAWLAYPNLGHVAAYEFHPGTLGVLPLAWLIDAADRYDLRGVVIASVAALCCREDLALMIAATGVLGAASHPSNRVRYLVLSVTTMAYMCLFLFVIHPRFAQPNGSFDLHFGHFGHSAAEAAGHVLANPGHVARHLSTWPRLLYLPMIFAPLACLPLARPRWLLPATPIFAMNLLSQFPTAVWLESHYLTTAVPFLVAAALEGAHVFSQRPGTMRHVPWALVGATCLAHWIAGGTPLSRDCPWSRFLEDDGTRAARVIVAAIPADASVQAPHAFLPHLAERRVVHQSFPPDRGTDMIVLDASHRRRFAHREDVLRTTEEPRTRELLSRADRRIVVAAGDLVLVARGDPRVWERRFVLGAGEPEPGDVALSRCLSLRRARVTAQAVELDLFVREDCPDDLAIRLGARETPERVDLLCDGLYSPAHFRAGEVIRSRHMLEPGEAAAIARNGLWLGLLRSSGARPEPADPRSVRVL